MSEDNNCIWQGIDLFGQQ